MEQKAKGLTAEQVTQFGQSKQFGHEHSGKNLLLFLKIFAVISAVFLALYLIILLPRFFKLYKELGTVLPVQTYFVIIILSLYPATLFFDIIYLGRKEKYLGYITNGQELVALLILIIGGFLFFGIGIGYLVIQTILPIYNVSTSF
jgi:hypothetical protein